MPSRPARLVLAALLLAFAATRTCRLTLLPVFVDEAKHLNWAHRLWIERQFLKPLDDGKLLQIAATAATLPFASDPLWAARLTTALVGALGLWAAWRLGRTLHDERVGLLAAGLYLVSPFALVYDRMNLADGYVSTFAALTLVATVALVREPGTSRGAALGLAMAGCVLSKVPGLMVLAFPFVGVALLGRWEARAWRALAIAYGLTAALVVFPVGYFFARTSQIEAKAAAVGSRAGLAVENLRLGGEWLWSYWTPPVFVLGVAGLLLALVRRRRGDLLLATAVVLPLALFVLLAYSWFPRYVFLTTIPLLVLAARVLADLSALLARAGRLRGLAGALGLAVLAIPALRFDSALLTDPAQAPLPAVDRFQYVQGWPSGYGWREVHERLRAERRAHPEGLTVVTDRRGHRTGQWALRAYFLPDPGVEVQGLELGQGGVRRLLDGWARQRPTFLVTSARARRFGGSSTLRAERVGVFRKPDGAFVCNLYRLVPREGGTP